ncbi:MAG: hypothetical protein KJZ59_05775, partial [Pararhodobacter sp.]|nr:hypothetical protein [Pararhodobacter sp.]
FCRALESVLSCDLQTNIYLTPDNAQGFRTHYDSHDVIVLQTHGSKTWNIYESPLELPLRSQAFDPQGFTPGKIIDTFVTWPMSRGAWCMTPSRRKRFRCISPPECWPIAGSMCSSRPWSSGQRKTRRCGPRCRRALPMRVSTRPQCWPISMR